MTFRVIRVLWVAVYWLLGGRLAEESAYKWSMRHDFEAHWVGAGPLRIVWDWVGYRPEMHCFGLCVGREKNGWDMSWRDRDWFVEDPLASEKMHYEVWKDLDVFSGTFGQYMELRNHFPANFLELERHERYLFEEYNAYCEKEPDYYGSFVNWRRDQLRQQAPDPDVYRKEHDDRE